MKHLFWMIFFLSLPVAAKDDLCPRTPYTLDIPEGYDPLKYAPTSLERPYIGGSFIASFDGEDIDPNTNITYTLLPDFVTAHIKRYEAQRASNYPPSMAPFDGFYDLDMFDEERAYFNKPRARLNEVYQQLLDYSPQELFPRSTANRLGKYFGCNTSVAPNLAPMFPKLANGPWQAVNNFSASLAQHFGEVWDVTGPVLSNHPKSYVGSDKGFKVPVPEAFFKVIFIELPGRGVGTFTFLFPNTDDPGYLRGFCSADKQYDLSRYLTSVANIEELTGLTFFPNMPDLEAVKSAQAQKIPALNEADWVGYCR